MDGNQEANIPSSFRPSLCKIQQLRLPRRTSALQRYSPCFAVQVAQLTVLRDDLGGVDLWMVGEYVRPPALINFL